MGPAQQPAQQPAQPNQVRVLLVDADISRDETAIHLSRAGYDVVGVIRRPAEAFFVAAQKQPDVIVTDYGHGALLHAGRIVELLRQRVPGVRIVVYSSQWAHTTAAGLGVDALVIRQPRGGVEALVAAVRPSPLVPVA